MADTAPDNQDSRPEKADTTDGRAFGRVVRRALLGVALLLVLAVVLVAGGVLWLRTSSGHGFVRGQIVQRVGDAMDGRIRLEGVDGDILTGLTLYGLVIEGEDGTPLVEADTVRAEYALRPLLDKRIEIGRVRLVDPRVNLIRGPDGRWNFQRLFPPGEPPPPDAGPGWGSYVAVGAIELVDGTVDVRLAEGEWPVIDWQENRFVNLNGTIRLGLFSRRQNEKRFSAEGLSFRATAPPLTVERLSGTGVITPDSVALRRIDLETEGSRIEADGRLLLGGRDTFALDLGGDVELEEIRRLFPEVVRLDGRARFEGRLTGPAARPTVVIDSGRVETARSAVAVSGTIAELAEPRFDFDATLEPLHPVDARRYVDAYPIAQPVTGVVRLEGPPSRLRVRGDLRAPAGAFSVRGTIDRTGALAYDLTATSNSLDVGRLLGRPAVDLVLNGEYRLDGRGTGPRDLSAALEVELDRSRIYGREVSAAATRGRLEGRTYVADTVWARTEESVMSGAGRFDLAGDGTMDASLVIDSRDLSEIAPELGGATGATHADVRLEGPYDGFDVTADLAAADLAVSGVTADSFAGIVQVDGVGGAMRVEADGRFRALTAAGIRADTAAVRATYADRRLDFEATLDHPGPTTTVVAGAGEFSGVPRIALDRLEYRGGEDRVRMADGSRLVYTDGEIRAEEVRLTTDGQTLRLDGVFALDGSSNLRFGAERVDLTTVSRLLGRPADAWEGTATVEGTLRGTRQSPIITLEGTVTEGNLRGFRFRRIEGDVDYQNELARVDLTVTTGEERALVLGGQVPIDLALVGGVDRLPRRPIDVILTGENLDLSIVGAFIPGLTDLSGPVDLRVEVAGTTENPEFDGQIVIEQGTFTIPATGTTYQEINGRIVFDNDRISISELHGNDGDTDEGDGRFSVSGTIDVQNLALGEFDLALEASGLRVVDQERRFVQVDGAIDLTGTTERPVVGGRIVVDEAIYRLPQRSGKDVIDLEEAVVYVDIPGTGSADERVERGSPSMWERARVNVDVVVTDDAILQNDNARIEIAGDLSVFKQQGSGAPTLSGTLDVRRGFYEEFGTRFTIESGSIFFYGTPEINPGLHVVATQTVEDVEGAGDVNIQITLGGTIRNPTIDLTSTPPFDKAEIISLALFGSPTPSAGQEGRFTRTVQDFAIGRAAAGLSSQLAQELNLDLVEISQGPGGDQATLFRVGKFITPDVYLTFEQEVRGGDEGDEQAVGLRYQFTDDFMIQATAGTRQSGLDLFWEFSY